MVARGFESFNSQDTLSANILSSTPKGTLIEEIPLQGKDSLSKNVSKNQTFPVSQTVPLCDSTSKTPSHTPLIINEVAWMGDVSSARHEWVELKNISKSPISLSNWQFFDRSKRTNIILNGILSPESFFLLSRKGEGNIKGDGVFSGTLNNRDEDLYLFDNACNLIDSVSANPSWPAGEGKTKKTMERSSDLSWHTSDITGGTPGKENSEGIIPGTKPITKNPNQTIPSSSINEKLVYVTEIMAGKGGYGTYEFIELFNNSEETLDLSGWSLKKESSTGKETTLVSGSRFEGKKILPRAFLLLANEGGYHDSVSADIMWPKSYTLAYAKNGVVLYDKEGNKVDRAYWETIPKDKSISRVLYTDPFVVSYPSPKQ